MGSPGDSNVVKIPASKVTGLLKLSEDPTPLRNRELVSADSARIDAIDVHPTGRENLEFRKSGMPGQWKLYEAASMTGC